MKRIAIYTRRSIYSEESESINMQIQACKDYFKRDDCNFEIFIDEGFSGSNIDRPDFIRMRNKIHNNEFDAVVVYKIDRISRNMVDFINLVSDFEKHNVNLISVTEGADPTTPSGKFVMNILASVAEMERANTIQRVTDNMLTLAKQGRWTGGNTPIGYKSIKVDNGTYLTIDENKRDLVINIFNAYLNTGSLNEVSKIFNINIASISDMLSSPVYVASSDRIHQYLKINGFFVFGEYNGNGYLTYGKRSKIKNKKSWNTKGYVVSVSKHEAIIDENTWLQVQSMLKENSIESRPKESNNSYLNTLVKCAKCGANMIINLTYTRVDGTKVYSYACGRRKKDSRSCNNGYIMVQELEHAIEDELKSIGLNKKLINNYIDSKDNKEYKKDKDKIRRKIDKNKLQINNLTDKLALLSNEASIAIINKIEQLSEDNRKLQTELLLIEKLESDVKNKEENINDIYSNIKTFNKMKYAPIEEKRKIIRTIIEKIDFDKDRNIAKITLRT
ncbi:DNA invertase Pin-like site-specific DNA recombinase [Tissierella praeacuta]|uniref:recombinase family protein n=1 Tax=Tissierella praeacuta TaxID=43131 RepID=UPI0010443B2B|nr:recombinase family protein [Tissierella praeacuta]TCU69655.1 DNA invertase Pin-like site-specific DNA recombinase [Tissierella praeacuta]